MFFVTQYNSSLSSFVPNFRILSQVAAENSLTEKFPLERKKNEQKGPINIIWLLLFFAQYISSLSNFVPNFRILSQVVAEKSLTEKKLKFSLERKKNEQINGLKSNMWLFYVMQYNSSLSSFVPNFRILSQVVAEKS